MKIVTCEQRSPEWFAARLGIPTASMFDRIITPSGKPSSQADGYANLLVAEWLSGQPGGMEPTPWMQRGTDCEPEARAFYEMDRGVGVSEVGFITMDEGQAGCSPDGLVGDDGMLEIKVPAPQTHVEYLLSGELPQKYRPQAQGQLMVAERRWCDFLSYHPDMPPVLVRVERDEAFIGKLNELLGAFTVVLSGKRKQLLERGMHPATMETT